MFISLLDGSLNIRVHIAHEDLPKTYDVIVHNRSSNGFLDGAVMLDWDVVAEINRIPQSIPAKISKMLSCKFLDADIATLPGCDALGGVPATARQPFADCDEVIVDLSHVGLLACGRNGPRRGRVG